MLAYNEFEELWKEQYGDKDRIIWNYRENDYTHESLAEYQSYKYMMQLEEEDDYTTNHSVLTIFFDESTLDLLNHFIQE